MKCVFVLAAFFIAGTFAEVPLSQFKGVQYELTKPNAVEYSNVFKAFGTDVDSKKLEKIMILTLDTPDTEGGEYTFKWVPAVGTEGETKTETFMNGKEITGTGGATLRYAVEGDKIVITITFGEKILTETTVFTDNEVKEIARFGVEEATRVYKKKNEAAATPAAVEGAAA